MLDRKECVIEWSLFFKQKTAYEMRISDWSSDVGSSDLPSRGRRVFFLLFRTRPPFRIGERPAQRDMQVGILGRAAKRDAVREIVARPMIIAAEKFQIGSALCRARGWQFV